MADRLTPTHRARLYLEASQKAGYTGLPDEQRAAYEEQMASHERAYPNVRSHALAGADQDFDKPLEAGTREHQRHLRRQDQLEHADVLRMRRELRGAGDRPTGSSSSRTRRKANPRTAGLRAARGAGSAGVSAVTGAAAGGAGQSTLLYAIGLLLGLSLLYLLVAGKGARALTGVVGIVTGGVRAFVAPVDPIASLERSLGAAPVSAAAAAAGGSGGGPSASSTGTGFTEGAPAGPGHSTSSGGNPGPSAGGRAAPPPSSIKLPPIVHHTGQGSITRDVEHGLHFKEVLERGVKAHKWTLPQARRSFANAFPIYARETHELAAELAKR
jgi:hypothetical protein